MSLWQLLRACWRYWPVVVVGVLLTAVGGYAVVRDDGVYYTRTELAFLAPQSAVNPNPLRTQSDSIIVTAGVVARQMVGTAELPKFASPDVTLAGAGMREGWSLRLVDTGGQWATNYASQRLVLEVVGPTPESVAERQRQLVSEVAATLETLQRSLGAPPEDHISVLPAPASPVISHVGGDRPRALAMTTALGVSVTLACVVVLERRRRGRGASAAPAAGQPSAPASSSAAAAGAGRP